ncbi:MAG: pyridoxal phosphate-dependent decarboxylase family protein [Ilumatobacteraceae bacterium]
MNMGKSEGADTAALPTVDSASQIGVPGLPATGWSADHTLAQLEHLRTHDVAWKDGRVFSLAYLVNSEVHDLATEAYRRFSGDNALNVEAFPSLRTMQRDVLEIVGGWLSAPATARGFFTSGGTESILMAMKAARDQFRHDETRRVTTPNVVLPTSAHAAFHKAAAYFDIQLRLVPVCSRTWRVEPAAMAHAADENTVMFVASAPQYPHGVVDPVVEIAALAKSRGANCHVDACMGGVTLPYLTRLGVPLPDWNFAVDGVTSMSVDLHKFGYAAKGASVVMYRDARLRSFQGFITDDWLGGVYGSSGMLGTKSGGPIAAAWAVLHHLGDDGYLRVTRAARETTLAIAEAIRHDERLELRAEPDAMLLSFGAAPAINADRPAVDIFAVADALATRGWYVDRQAPPPSIHLTVNAVHATTYRAFLDDLAAVLDNVGVPTASRGVYGTLE